MQSSVLREAKRLHNLGFAIHWLHKKSKRPLESGWTTGPRKKWDELEKTYKPGLNVGVRLGKASSVKEKFLAVIDVDVKSSEERHRKEVLERISVLTKVTSLPAVKSGRGNGSRHYYILTPKPIAPFKAEQSSEVVKVSMPSVQPSKKELAALSREEINKGIRLRPAWEIALMGEGQQVVLPPSVHPDSGKPYAWVVPFEMSRAITFDEKLLTKRNVDNTLVGKSVDNGGKLLTKSTAKPGPKSLEGFEIVAVDIETLNLSPKIKAAIVEGKGIEDRSASLLPIARALFKAGLSQNKILSILTNKEYFLGHVGFDHAKTSDRKRAAAWVYKFTLARVQREDSAKNFFSGEIVEAVPLTKEQRAKSQAAFEELYSWLLLLDTTNQGNYRGTLYNTVAVLTNAVSFKLVRRDVFALRDSYGCKTPWGGKVGAHVDDDEVKRIKYWIANTYSFEPTVNTINEALTQIATDNSFNPIKDWLEALPAWDETPRLDTFLRDHFNAKGNEEYLSQVFRKWMCAMVIRIYEPGTKFDWMPIFEGAQGVGKSSFGRILCGEKHFLDWLPDLMNKDAALALQGIWSVEMGELASFRKNEIEAVKAFITRTVDKVRPPYGQRWIEAQRSCVFFGTTNFETYLRDDSGNRRFKPCKVGQLDFEALIEQREQLFAEALWLYKSGFESGPTLELTGEAKTFEVQIQSEKMVLDDAALMEENIRQFMASESTKDFDEQFDFSMFKLGDLFEGTGHFGNLSLPLKNWKYDNRNVQFAGKALKNIGAATWKSDGLKYWKIEEKGQVGE